MSAALAGPLAKALSRTMGYSSTDEEWTTWAAELSSGQECSDDDMEQSALADADFIAHAREDIPALLSALEAATGRAEALEAALVDVMRSELGYLAWDGWREVQRLRDIATAALTRADQ